METVAFPKESDIATKPNLVQMVPLCQIALDPHLCLTLATMETVAFPKESDIAAKPNLVQTLSNCTRSSSVSHIGYDENGGIDIAAKPSLVQVVPLCHIALDPHLCLIGYDGNGGISKRE